MESIAARHARPAPDNPDGHPSLGNELERGNKSTAALHEALDRLTEQLQPVLGPERPVPVDGNAGDDDRPSTAPLVREAFDLTARVSLMDRLQP